MPMRRAASAIEPVSAITSRRSALPGPMAFARARCTRMNESGLWPFVSLANTVNRARVECDWSVNLGRNQTGVNLPIEFFQWGTSEKRDAQVIHLEAPGLRC